MTVPQCTIKRDYAQLTQSGEQLSGPKVATAMHRLHTVLALLLTQPALLINGSTPENGVLQVPHHGD